MNKIKKISLITGANSGIGKMTAIELAKKQHTLILWCRNQQKAEAAIADIHKVTGHTDIHLFLGDLASMASVDTVCKAILKQFDRIDNLINNAGLLMGSERKITEDGFEFTLAVNHLAPFVLTKALLPLLQQSTEGRIINVASEVHQQAAFSFADMNMEKGYSGFKAYCNSKLFNILFTKKLAQMLCKTAIKTNSLHPGAVNSNFGNDTDGIFGYILRMSKPFFITPGKGAETTLFLALNEAGRQYNGDYFKDKMVTKPSDAALSQYNMDRLWESTEALLDTTFSGISN